ncbi:unnamed protein product [Cyprideis torosa]|uniref:Uncharacterized protein n=1 Tax=Cyprideis torosa TaxID=163714 RepID=A0A7R8W9L3_9CRUS|nr:unnamed protein product [Cyprideis torosa]CAG0889876.1 unnamed protein product [Cyprideis torosa]
MAHLGGALRGYMYSYKKRINLLRESLAINKIGDIAHSYKSREDGGKKPSVECKALEISLGKIASSVRKERGNGGVSPGSVSSYPLYHLCGAVCFYPSSSLVPASSSTRKEVIH